MLLTEAAVGVEAAAVACMCRLQRVWITAFEGVRNDNIRDGVKRHIGSRPVGASHVSVPALDNTVERQHQHRTLAEVWVAGDSVASGEGACT